MIRTFEACAHVHHWLVLFPFPARIEIAAPRLDRRGDRPRSQDLLHALAESLAQR